MNDAEILIEKINLFFPVKLRPSYVAMVQQLERESSALSEVIEAFAGYSELSPWQIEALKLARKAAGKALLSD